MYLSHKFYVSQKDTMPKTKLHDATFNFHAISPTTGEEVIIL